MHRPDAVPFKKNAFKRIGLAVLLPAALLSIDAAATAQPSSVRQATSRLTVEISGIKNASGEVCVSLFAGSAGFPNNEENIVEKQCIAAVETNPEAASPSGPQSELPPELQTDPQSDEEAVIKPTSDLAAIPAPVMENIIEGLANNASNLATSTNTTTTETTAETTTETNAETDTLDDVVITQAVLAITFTDIAPGTYAVSVLHDENEDGELNTGTFGIPAEGFGFSKNPEIRTGAPDFSEAAIVVVGAEATTQVELIYY